MNPAPNLFFVGPMGAGKTTVGRHVADLLGLPFFDLDHEIEVHTGATVALIFELEGEAGFRRRESALLEDMAARSDIVLATGGGAVLDPRNREVMRARSFVIWLDAALDAQLSRLSRDRQRPLLKGPDRRQRLQQLAAVRNPLYAEVADLHLRSAGVGNSGQVAHDVVELLRVNWQRGERHVAA
jgi:shikimate kinase